ncbi:hypothetical protein NKG05_30525 [Oerskovia sp. M15]
MTATEQGPYPTAQRTPASRRAGRSARPGTDTRSPVTAPGPRPARRPSAPSRAGERRRRARRGTCTGRAGSHDAGCVRGVRGVAQRRDRHDARDPVRRGPRRGRGVVGRGRRARDRRRHRGAREYRDAGASVQILEATGQIDGARCEALAGVDGVNAAGALRTGEPLRALNLPRASSPASKRRPGCSARSTADGSPGPVCGCPQIWPRRSVRSPVTRSRRPPGPRASAPSTRTPTTDETVFSGTRPSPRTRDRAVRRVLGRDLARRPRDHDAPAHDRRRRPDLRGAAHPEAAQRRLGATYDASAEFSARLTEPAPIAAGVLGLVLGFVAIRLRRLELAAALHARVPRAALTWQVLLETAAWAGAGIVVTVPALWWLAGAGGDGLTTDQVSTWIIGMRTVLAGAGAVLVGAVAGALTTREKHLFKYFKER